MLFFKIVFYSIGGGDYKGGTGIAGVGRDRVKENHRNTLRLFNTYMHFFLN